MPTAGSTGLLRPVLPVVPVTLKTEGEAEGERSAQGSEAGPPPSLGGGREKKRARKGKTPQAARPERFDEDSAVTSACSAGNYSKAEVIIGRNKASQVRLNIGELIGQIRNRLRSKHFEKPPDSKAAPRYYSDDSEATTTWDTNVMCLEKMEEKECKNLYVSLAKQKWGNDRADMCLSLVEQDLNLIVYNAVIYNPVNHGVNKAALRFRDTFQKIMAEFKWEDCRFCAKCHGDEVYFENPINICDMCCAGTHTQCMAEIRPAQQWKHPLRKDDEAWFCSDACCTLFEELAKQFLLPDGTSPPIDQNLATHAVLEFATDTSAKRDGENLASFSPSSFAPLPWPVSVAPSFLDVMDVKDILPPARGVVQAGSKGKTVESRVVLARQSKKEDLEFGVTIGPQTPEQKRAAIASPRKVIVLWPIACQHDWKTSWGMCCKEHVQEANDEVAHQFFSQNSLTKLHLHQKSLEWCRNYLKDELALSARLPADGALSKHGNAASGDMVAAIAREASDIGVSSGAGEGGGDAGMQSEIVQLAVRVVPPRPLPRGSVAHVLNAPAAAAAAKFSSLIASPSSVNERALSPTSGGGEGRLAVNFPKANPVVSAITTDSPSAMTLVDVQDKNEQTKPRSSKDTAPAAAKIPATATATDAAISTQQAHPSAQSSPSNGARVGVTKGGAGISRALAAAAKTLILPPSPSVAPATPTTGACRPPLPPSRPLSPGARGGRALATTLDVTAAARFALAHTHTNAHTSADFQSAAVTAVEKATPLKQSAGVSLGPQANAPRPPPARPQSLNKSSSAITAVATAATTASSSTNASTCGISTIISSISAVVAVTAGTEATAGAGGVGSKRGREDEAQGMGVDPNMLELARALVGFKVQAEAEREHDSERDLQEGRLKKRKVDVEAVLNAASCGGVKASSSRIPCSDPPATAQGQPATATTGRKVEAKGSHSGAGHGQGVEIERGPSRRTSLAPLPQSPTRASCVPPTPSIASLATPPAKPVLPASASIASFAQGKQGDREQMESQGHEYFDVVRIAGTEGYACKTFPKYSFPTAEGAAWGYDVLCLAKKPEIDPSKLHFGSKLNVVRKVMDAFKVVLMAEQPDQHTSTGTAATAQQTRAVMPGAGDAWGGGAAAASGWASVMSTQDGEHSLQSKECLAKDKEILELKRRLQILEK